MSGSFTTVFVVIALAWHVCCATALAVDGATAVVRSPDGRNTITLASDAEGDSRELRLSVSRGKTQILEPSRIHIRLEPDRHLAAGAKLLSVEEGQTDATFSLPWGKSAEVRDHCNWARVRLTGGGGIIWDVELRAYDDGVAYRYVLPEQEALGEFAIVDESTAYAFAGKPTIHFTTAPHFKSDHEFEYHRQPLGALQAETLIDLPMLAVWPDGTAAAVTEARLRDFADMYLVAADRADGVDLECRLSPRPDRKDVCVVGRTPHASPWRVILLGPQAGKLLESSLVLCLNDPPEGDYRWAQPGKTTWHWWNGTAQEPGLPFTVGMNFETHKHYVDFCARYGIAYHAVVADDRPWHVQSKPSFSPQADTDILVPRPELELPRLIEYADAKGVGIRLWVHWKALDRRLEEAFAAYEAWGIKGLMVDFLDRDDQEMVAFCDRVLHCAAEHHLHIQFHGSYKPSGEQRTFPHLFNREGVLNLEYLKWSQRCTPPHDVAVAYTRLLAGPLDYHLGGFRGASRAQFVERDALPMVYGTRCHQLAMYVIYENPMPMVCDTPSTYEGAKGFDFLVDVPTTWDETRFIVGEPCEYIVVARRKGRAWYLGGMTDWTPRDIRVPLSFLGPGVHDAKVYGDGSLDEARPNEVRIDRRSVSADEDLSLRLAPGGGFVATIRPEMATHAK